MKKLFTKGALVVAGVLLSLALSILGLVGNQSDSTKSYSGVTNYDEVAPGELSWKIEKLELNPAGNATSSAFICRPSGEEFTRWIDAGETYLFVDATSTSANYRFQVATTTQPATVYLTAGALGTSGSGAFMPVGSTSLAYAGILNRTIATGSNAVYAVASSTVGSLLPWFPNQCVGLSISNPSNPTEGFAVHPATSTGSGLRKVTLTISTYATSTDNNQR